MTDFARPVPILLIPLQPPVQGQALCFFLLLLRKATFFFLVMGLCFSFLVTGHDRNPNLPPLSGSVASQTTSTTTGSNNSGSSNSNSTAAAGASGGSDDFSISTTSPSTHMLPHPNLRNYSFSELRTATRNFKNDSVLGEGGFGKVYKGWLDLKNGAPPTAVAIKKLHPESMQGVREWQSEVNFLGNLSHPHLVKLLGYCWEEEELLLVYEFMPKGSLENHLFGRGSAVQPLPWDVRLKILIGAARGLAFLHSLDRKVIYRDFKASNILLDGSYNAKLSDFGLAKMGPTPSKSHVTTQVVGTYGYAAPEYVATGHLYVKSDVYGFGVVLVEMLTGLRALDTSRPAAQLILADWVKPRLNDRRKLKSIMDSRLEGKYSSKSALQIAHLALNCLENEPKNRPGMQEIVETLERLASANERPGGQRVHSSNSETSSTTTTHGAHRRSPLQSRQAPDVGYSLPTPT